MWPGPEGCGEQTLTGVVCSGCEQHCAYDYCEEFDTNCVSRGVDDAEKLEVYGVQGRCECRNVADCPVDVKDCACPGETVRVCTECALKFIDTASGQECRPEPSQPPNPNCMALDARFCPPAGPSGEEVCVEWGCACFNPEGLDGTLDSEPAIDQVAGTAVCPPASCPYGTDFTLNFEEIVIPPMGPGEEETVMTLYPCCLPPLWKEAVCLEWAGRTCMRFQQFSPAQDCGVRACCLDASLEPPEGGPGEGEGPGGAAPISCTVEFDMGVASLSCDISRGTGTWAGEFQQVPSDIGGFGGGLRRLGDQQREGKRVVPVVRSRGGLKSAARTLMQVPDLEAPTGCSTRLDVWESCVYFVATIVDSNNIGWTEDSYLEVIFSATRLLVSSWLFYKRSVFAGCDKLGQ